MDVSHEAMLMYVRSIKAPPPPVDTEVDPKKGRVKKFFKSLSFRKPKHDDDDHDDSRWSDVFRSDRKRGDSFFRRLSFLQPRDSETLSTYERPSFLDRLVADKPSPAGTDATRTSDADLASPPDRRGRTPSRRRNTTATPVDSTAHHTMMLGRVGIPTNSPPRRHSDVPSYHAVPLPQQPVEVPLVAVCEEEDESSKEEVDAGDAASMHLKDVNVTVNSTQVALVQSQDVISMELEMAAMASQDVDVKEPQADCAQPETASPLPALRRIVAVKPLAKTLRLEPVRTLSQVPTYQPMDDASSLWFDETLAMMGAPNF